MNDMVAPHIEPAPAHLPHHAGKYYVWRGPDGRIQYLQEDGSWGFPAHYFRDRIAADEMLRRNAFLALVTVSPQVYVPPEGVIPSNIDADAFNSRAAKREMRSRRI